MKKKVLVLDLDGTAITNDYVLSDELVNHCKSLESLLDIIIATGRSASDGFRYYKKLALNSYMVCYNGAFIWNPLDNSVFFCDYMKESEMILHFLFNNYEWLGLENIIISSGVNTFALNRQNAFMCDMMFDEELPFDFVSDSFMLKCDKVHRIILSCKRDINTSQTAIKHLSNSISVFGWKGREDIIDISMSNVNKANAVGLLLSRKGLSLKNVVSFGDGLNDIPLLKESGIGIAMKNSMREVKNAADYITKYSNQNNGVYFFIRDHADLFH